MKIRSCYVSNSSSSSFILKSDSDVEQLRSQSWFTDIKVFRVGEVRDIYIDSVIKYLTLDEEEYRNYIKELERNKVIPYFIINSKLQYYVNLEEGKDYLFSPEIKNEYYITEAISNRIWYEISKPNFDVFDDDL